MSSPVTSQVIRIPVKTDRLDQLQDVATNAIPAFWNGVSLRFEFAFYYRGELIDVSNIDSITIEIKETTTKTALALMAKTLSSTSLDNSLTDETWADFSKQHVAFEFDHSETKMVLPTDQTAFWMVISVVLSDSKEIVLGAGTINVKESGHDGTPPSSVVEPVYFTATQSDARYERTINNTARDANIALALSQSAAAQASAATATTLAVAAMPLAGGTFVGPVLMGAATTFTLAADPTTSLQCATKAYVDTSKAACVLLTGATAMTGALTLFAADPTTDNQAVRRKFITDNYIIKTGATDFTGHQKLFNSSPTDPLHASSRGYVDAQISGLVSTAPSNLNTLAKIATSINNDPSFKTTVILKDGSVTMTAALNLYTGSTPSGANAIWKSYADTTYLKVDGTTALTGHLTLINSDGTLSGNNAVRKGYVDGVAALKVDIAGSIMNGPLRFSGGTNYGVQIANFAASSYPVSPTAGALIYDTTNAYLAFWSGSTWKILNATGSAASWFDGSGTPSGGTGANGDYYLETQDDDNEGRVWKKITGSWSNIVGARLPLRGGTMLGSITFDDAVLTQLIFPGAVSMSSVDSGMGPWYVEFTSGFGMNLTITNTDVQNAAGGFDGSVYKVGSTQVLTNQQSAIADATGTGDVVAKFNLWLAAARTHGLIAT